VERAIRDALARAGESEDDAPQRVPVLRALGTLHLLRADLSRSREISEELLDIAESLQDPALLADAHQLAGIAEMSLDVEGGLRHLDRSIDYFGASPPARVQFRVGPNPGVVSHVISGLLLWITGFPDRAQRRVDRGLELAGELGHPYTLAYALFHSSLLALWQHDIDRLGRLAEQLERQAKAHDYPIWRALSMVLGGTAQIAAGAHQEGLAAVQRGFSLYSGLETPPIFWSGLLTIRAEGCLVAGRIEEARRYLDEATGAVWAGDPEEAHLEILRGDLLLAGPDPDPKAAEDAYVLAAGLAESRGARTTRLQALTRLATLRQGTREESAALTELRTALDGFTEGFESGPLVGARRALDAVRSE